jgi:hypothetical protein
MTVSKDHRGRVKATLKAEKIFHRQDKDGNIFVALGSQHTNTLFRLAEDTKSELVELKVQPDFIKRGPGTRSATLETPAIVDDKRVAPVTGQYEQVISELETLGGRLLDKASRIDELVGALKGWSKAHDEAELLLKEAGEKIKSIRDLLIEESE